ncbi:MAG: hypothetical protein RLZZ21_214 [Planctomycetota bacterium]
MDGLAGGRVIMPFESSIPLWVVLLTPGLYLLGVGLLHLRRRPVAIAGGLDVMLLAAAVAGPMIAGPLDLLQPAGTSWPWRLVVPLVCFAFLTAVVVLATRPRLVVYNVSLDQLRPVVAEIASRLDPEARWAGETVALPGRGVQVHLDGRGGMRSMSLVAIGARNSPEGWADVTRRVRHAVRRVRVRRSPWAAVFIGCGCLLLAASAWLAFAGFFRPAPAPSIEPPVATQPAA